MSIRPGRVASEVANGDQLKNNPNLQIAWISAFRLLPQFCTEWIDFWVISTPQEKAHGKIDHFDFHARFLPFFFLQSHPGVSIEICQKMSPQLSVNGAWLRKNIQAMSKGCCFGHVSTCGFVYLVGIFFAKLKNKSFKLRGHCHFFLVGLSTSVHSSLLQSSLQSQSL